MNHAQNKGTSFQEEDDFEEYQRILSQGQAKVHRMRGDIRRGEKMNLLLNGMQQQRDLIGFVQYTTKEQLRRSDDVDKILQDLARREEAKADMMSSNEEAVKRFLMNRKPAPAGGRGR